MTHNKMIRTLSSYDDVALFEIKDLDKFDFDKEEFTKPVRDVVLLSDIIKQFEEKSGEFYNEYHFVSSFKDLVKLIESGKSGGYLYKHYQDSYDEFVSKWNELHPNESYDAYIKRIREEKRRKAEREWGAFTGEVHPWLMTGYNNICAPISMRSPKSTKYHK